MSDLTPINGAETEINGEKEILASEQVINSNITSSNNAKILKKSVSEHLDLTNKNINSLNGNYEINSPLSAGGGRISYDCDFLFSLKDSPLSQKKPEHITDSKTLDIFQRLARPPPGLSLPEAPKQTFLPSFGKNAPRSGSGTPSRRSQHGKQGSKDTPRSGGGGGGRQGSSNNLGGKSSLIEITLSRDVKLNECENAWKPNRAKKDEVVSDAENAITEEIYKKFRSILNKLTPQNFKKMISQVQELDINTHERLVGVINLVFEKAIDEPNFAETYALMCKELEQIKVKKASSENNNSEEFIGFKYLIIFRCQQEFEKNKTDERLSTTKLKEIEDCKDLEERKVLQSELDEEERKSRMRSVGNVRFIGELFKQQYITSGIMISCIQSLLKKLEEETMECLCKLLSTIGKSLETQHKVDLQTYFTEMRKIAEDKSNKLNSRIRFMLKDMIELRLNNWTPRQKLSAPVRLENVDSDMDRMSRNQYPKYTSTSSSQRDDRLYSGRGGGSRSFNEDSGWSPVTSNKRTKEPYLNTNKLKNMNSGVSDVSLHPQSHSMWSRGSASKKKVSALPTTPKMNNIPPLSTSRKNSTATKTFNSFMLLDNPEISTDALNPNNLKPSEKVVTSEKPPTKPAPTKQPQVTVKTLIGTLSGSGDPYSELLDCLQIGPSQEELPSLIRDLIIWSLEKNNSKTIKVIGKVTGTLVCKKLITCEKFLEIFKQAIDNIQHIFDKGEEIWDSLSKLFWSHSAQNELTFAQLHTVSSTIIKLDKGYEFLLAVFLEKVEDSNEVDLVKRVWVASEKMTLIDWMPLDKAQEFTLIVPLDFISCGEKEVINPENMCAKLLETMEKSTPLDTLDKWIQINVGESVKEPWFVRALTEALYTYIICSPDYPMPRFDKNSPRFNSYNQLLITYVTTQSKLELECLFAIQNLMNKLEHPQCIALNLFENLWESEVISNDTFLAWELDTTQQEGKGVMLKMLTSFFAVLKADDSSDDTSPIEDDQSTLD